MIGQLVKADGSLTECDGKAAEVLINNDFDRPDHISVNVHKLVLLYY